MNSYLLYIHCDSIIIILYCHVAGLKLATYNKQVTGAGQLGEPQAPPPVGIMHVDQNLVCPLINEHCTVKMCMSINSYNHAQTTPIVHVVLKANLSCVSLAAASTGMAPGPLVWDFAVEVKPHNKCTDTIMILPSNEHDNNITEHMTIIIN